MVTAAKYMDDIHYTNRFYAEVCRVDLVAFNRLEETFLSLIAFDLFVTLEEFDIIQENHIQRQIAILRHEQSISLAVLEPNSFGKERMDRYDGYHIATK